MWHTAWDKNVRLAIRIIFVFICWSFAFSVSIHGSPPTLSERSSVLESLLGIPQVYTAHRKWLRPLHRLTPGGDPGFWGRGRGTGKSSTGHHFWRDGAPGLDFYYFSTIETTLIFRTTKNEPGCENQSTLGRPRSVSGPKMMTFGIPFCIDV